MTKRLLRSAMGFCCHASGTLHFAEWRSRHDLTILCYHRVLPFERKAAHFNPDLVVTPEAFLAHCRCLAKFFEVLPLNQAIRVWRRNSSLGQPLAAVTFDDGYGDNYEYAAPILSTFGFRATFFVIAGLVDTQESPWYDQMGRLFSLLVRQGRLPSVLGTSALETLLGLSLSTEGVSDRTVRQLTSLTKTLGSKERQIVLNELQASAGPEKDWMSGDVIMNRHQLQALADAGHEIGSHGLTHTILPQMNDESLESEIVGSRHLLEEKLKQPVRSFCYPNGDADDRTVRAVDAAGYTCAVGVIPGHNEQTQDIYRLRRWFIHEERLAGTFGRTSDTLLRMELCGLGNRLFGRRRRR